MIGSRAAWSGRMRRGCWWAAAAAALLLVPVRAQQPVTGAAGQELFSLKFNNAPIELVLGDYAQKTGRTILSGPKTPKVMVTLRSQTPLTLSEYLQAVETVLAMNGIGIVKMGDKFVKIVPIAEARQEAMPILQQEVRPVYDADGTPVTNAAGEVMQQLVMLDESDELVSQLITLKHITLEDARKAIEPLKHAHGQVHLFESINSVLVTDSAANVNRIMEILRYIDQPVEAREEPHVIGIRHSKASDIKKMLEEIIAESQEEAQRAGQPRQREAGSPGVVAPVTPPGVIRASRIPMPVAPAVSEEVIEQAERGIIRGKVKIVADDRTNILIIITRPENMKFFEKIIQVLDVETDPDVVVRVFRLEFAQAKDIAEMLNELIGASEGGAEAPAAKSPVAEGESTALRAIEAARAAAAAASAAAAEPRKSKVGELSKENIKILADERTNALVIMASRGDAATLEEIIRDMDIMLSQVLVEAVVLEVNLDNTLESGFDWLQRSLIAYNESNGGRTPIMSFAGSAGGGSLAPRESLSFTDPSVFPAADGTPLSGLTYYMTFFQLNLDTVLRLVATDSRTRILSSPVVMTTDNKDATIDVSTERYFYKGKKYVGGGDNPFYEDDVETKKVGITLTVTPRINEKKFVVMELTQQIDNVSGSQIINNTEWPVVTTRKLEAEVAVVSGETIVLGGLVQNSTSRKENKVPFLGDIPLLGALFRSTRNDDVRTEVIVFITPYVMTTPADIEAEAMRRRQAVHAESMWPNAWSGSRLGQPAPAAGTAAPPVIEEAAPPRAAVEEAPPVLMRIDPAIARENARLDRRLEKLDAEIEEDVFAR